MPRKNNSRRSERNLIYKMNMQGYTVAQIEMKTSIMAEHINYVLHQYEADLAKRKADSPELQARAEIQAEVENRRARTLEPANPPERQAMKDELRAEILAELAASRPAPAPIEVAPQVTLKPEPELDEYETIEVKGEEELPKAKPRRKRKTA